MRDETSEYLVTYQCRIQQRMLVRLEDVRTDYDCSVMLRLHSREDFRKDVVWKVENRLVM